MEDFIFDTGLVTFSINKKYEVTFNPSDWNFVERVTSTFEILSEKQEEVERALKSVENMRGFFLSMRELDMEMREYIDGIFGAPVCAAVFGDMNIYALAGGAPVWANFLFTLWDRLDSNLTRESKIKNPKIQKYLDKYQRGKK